jgi:hypothetical protein
MTFWSPAGWRRSTWATCIRFFPSCKKTVLRESALKVSRPVSYKNTPSPGSLSPALIASEFVLVRWDGNLLAFTLPYDKPFKVLCQYLHAFEFQVGSKVEVTASHRLLKVCHRGENPVTKPGGSRLQPQGDKKNAQGERTQKNMVRQSRVRVREHLIKNLGRKPCILKCRILGRGCPLPLQGDDSPRHGVNHRKKSGQSGLQLPLRFAHITRIASLDESAAWACKASWFFSWSKNHSVTSF